MLAVPVSLNRSIAEDWQYTLRPYSPIREGSISPTRSQRKTIPSTKVTASANTKTLGLVLESSDQTSPFIKQAKDYSLLLG
jgi:hypothetical protein